MLEILVLISLTSRIGKTVEAKGYKSGKYKWGAVGLWFGGEIIGLILGAIITGGDESGTCLMYLIGLAGAAIGAAIANSNANNLPVIGPSLVPATASVGIPMVQEDHVHKLKKLKEMVDEGLITTQDYEAQKGEILSRLVSGSTPQSASMPSNSLVMESDGGGALEKFIAKINSIDLDKSAEEYYKHGNEFMEKNQFDDAILEFVKAIRVSSPDQKWYQSAQKALNKMGFSEADIRQIGLQVGE